MLNTVLERIRYTLLLVVAFSSVDALAVSAIPPPVLNDVAIDAAVVLANNSGFAYYHYNYSITNPGTNTGNIVSFRLDVSRGSDSQSYNYGNLSMPFGLTTKTFGELYDSRQDPKGMIPFGFNLPSTWWGTIGGSGLAIANGSGLGGEIPPGFTQNNIILLSPAPPTIREVTLVPDWVYVSLNPAGISDAEAEEARLASDSVRYKTKTVGPSSVRLGTWAHWNQLSKDLDEAITLGWIFDTTLGETLKQQLVDAGIELEAKRRNNTKDILRLMLDTLAQSGADQINQQSRDLIKINVSVLIDYTPDDPFEGSYSLTPSTTSLVIGTEHTLTAKVIDLSKKGIPVEGHAVYLSIIHGPNVGKVWSGFTDLNGEFIVKYTGSKVGTDHVIYEFQDVKLDNKSKEPIRLASYGLLPSLILGNSFYPYAIAQAHVNWTGGPDLVIPFFIPHEIITTGGNPVFITEVTENIGIVDSAESTTRWYLTDKLPFDVNTATVIGERRVPTVSVDSTSIQHTTEFQVPAGLPEGLYYGAACADAANEVTELNEANNCSFNKLLHTASKIIQIDEPRYSPPNCDTAKPNKTILWPPNHKLQKIKITGVTDPDDDSSGGSSSSHDSSSSSSHDSSSSSHSSGDSEDESSDDSNSSSSSSHDSSSGSSSSHGSSSGSSSSHDSSNSSNSHSKDDSDDDSSSSSDDSDNESDDDITIKITSIQQDEPVNGLGDGDTSPDGFGVGTSTAKVRAERSGLENGRIYIIGFEATNEAGASCTGSVTVGVPHDKKSTPIDSGARYDSTLQ